MALGENWKTNDSNDIKHECIKSHPAPGRLISPSMRTCLRRYLTNSNPGRRSASQQLRAELLNPYAYYQSILVLDKMIESLSRSRAASGEHDTPNFQLEKGYAEQEVALGGLDE